MLFEQGTYYIVSLFINKSLFFYNTYIKHLIKVKRSKKTIS